MPQGQVARGSWFWWQAFVAALIGVFGAAIAAGGLWLILLGGSWYYLPAGIGLIVTAWLLFRGQGGALWVYLLVYGATVLWALWEAGLNGWAQVPRLVAPTVVLVLVILAAPGLRRRGTWLAGIALALLGGGALAYLAGGRGDAVAAIEPEPLVPQSAPDAGADWPAYGGTHQARRYSTLSQITPENVAGLRARPEKG